MLDKLGAAKQMAEEMKMKLETISVSGEAGSGLVKAIASANRKILDVQIDPQLLSSDRAEELQELLVVAMNRALEAAENVSESEMRSMMGSLMPGLGGLFR